MGFRFNRRVSILPGLRVNLSKSGASLSIGHRGFWYTVGSKGRRATVGLPGTGLTWTEQYPWPHGAPHAGSSPPAAPPHAGHQANFALAVIVVMILLALAALGGRPG
jgi:hypothetical protein